MLCLKALGGFGELVTRLMILQAHDRAIASGKTACINVNASGVISPDCCRNIDKRDKASIE